MFNGLEVLYFTMSATTTQLLTGGEFYNCVMTPVKKCICKCFYTNNSKMSNVEL